MASGTSSAEDQSVLPLQNFDSSDEEGATKGEDRGHPIHVPEPPELALKKAKNVANTNKNKNKAAVVLVSRIPHGFFEHEMRGYFSQFGTITNLRLSRNKSTGASKHYAFIEFASEEVASIVAQATNNYLMFGHILKCTLIPEDQLHPDTFKGANKRFKPVPWSKIEGRKLASGKDHVQWSKVVRRERTARAKNMKRLQDMGYEFEPSILKNIRDLPERQILASVSQGVTDAVLETNDL